MLLGLENIKIGLGKVFWLKSKPACNGKYVHIDDILFKKKK